MIQRFSSRRQRLDESFLGERLHGALAYDCIAGSFSSGILEVAGEALAQVAGPVRVVFNSDLNPRDVEVARAVPLAYFVVEDVGRLAQRAVQHPFDLRYAQIDPVDWETCSTVLDADERIRELMHGW